MCHYLDQNPKEDKDGDEDDGDDGSTETGDPGRAGGLDRNSTLLLGQLGLHLGPPHAQAVTTGKKYIRSHNKNIMPIKKAIQF